MWPIPPPVTPPLWPPIPPPPRLSRPPPPMPPPPPPPMPPPPPPPLFTSWSMLVEDLRSKVGWLLPAAASRPATVSSARFVREMPAAAVVPTEKIGRHGRRGRELWLSTYFTPAPHRLCKFTIR